MKDHSTSTAINTDKNSLTDRLLLPGEPTSSRSATSSEESPSPPDDRLTNLRNDVNNCLESSYQQANDVANHIGECLTQTTLSIQRSAVYLSSLPGKTHQYLLNDLNRLLTQETINLMLISSRGFITISTLSSAEITLDAIYITLAIGLLTYHHYHTYHRNRIYQEQQPPLTYNNTQLQTQDWVQLISQCNIIIWAAIGAWIFDAAQSPFTQSFFHDPIPRISACVIDILISSISLFYIELYDNKRASLKSASCIHHMHRHFNSNAIDTHSEKNQLMQSLLIQASKPSSAFHSPRTAFHTHAIMQCLLNQAILFTDVLGIYSIMANEPALLKSTLCLLFISLSSLLSIVFTLIKPYQDSRTYQYAGDHRLYNHLIKNNHDAINARHTFSFFGCVQSIFYPTLIVRSAVSFITARHVLCFLQAVDAFYSAKTDTHSWTEITHQDEKSSQTMMPYLAWGLPLLYLVLGNGSQYIQEQCALKETVYTAVSPYLALEEVYQQINQYPLSIIEKKALLTALCDKVVESTNLANLLSILSTDNQPLDKALNQISQQLDSRTCWQDTVQIFQDYPSTLLSDQPFTNSKPVPVINTTMPSLCPAPP